jgi:hypothetical protein
LEGDKGAIMKCTCDKCGEDMTKLFPFRKVGSVVVEKGKAICIKCGDGEAEISGWHIVGPEGVMGLPDHWVPDVLQ